MMERCVLLLLVLAVVTVHAGPLNVRKTTCIETCPASAGSSKFNFVPGKKYSFDYMSDTQTKLSNEPKQTSGLRIKARANFEMVSRCEMVLKIEDAALEELKPSDGRTFLRSPHTQRFEAALQANDLHFAYIDGAVSHVCAHQNEPTWVLNAKRGIISMIQNTMLSLKKEHNGNEVDITGDCKVRYSTSMTQSSRILVKREKDLLTCTSRQNHRSSIQSMPYFVRSETQSVPFTISSHSCQQTIKDGRFEKIECAEMHRLRSFTRGQGGARTKVSQTLNFVKEGPASGRSHLHPKHHRTSLTFDFSKKKDVSGTDMHKILSVLAGICARSRDDVRPHSPRLFTELVYILRRLNEKDLRKVYEIVDRRRACRTNNVFLRRMFLDAIPMLGNAHSMSIMKDMIVKKKVSNIEANLWLTSLAFVQKPTIQMLAYLRPLLDEQVPRKQAVLGLSAMVHQYCRGRRECHTEPEIQAIGRALRRFLHGDCSAVSSEQQNQILIAVKAIGNAGVLSFVSPDLVKCARREENPMAVRVASVEAFRRMDCSVDRKPLMAIFKDIKIDSELRINAYLSVMTCPNEEVVEVVKNQLAIEKVNQVGSFVWTHLTNRAETADPTEKYIKDIVEDVTLKKEFQMDKLKFSRNVEKSVFFKSMNAGGRFDSNLIWSPKSFIPRSMSLNLTSHLFGQSYNFFEINGRVEGLETLLEHYFGPDGYFRSAGKPTKPTKESALSAQDFKFMDNKFKLQNDRLRASLAFRVFGHEIGFFELFEEANRGEGINFLEILIKLATHQEMEWTKNIMFLDTTVTVPTITGLPLELSINGTASLALKVKGKLDIRRLMSWPTTFDIDGSLQPSGSVEISAMMGVDAFYSRYGMKMVSNVHSSTQLDATLKATNSEKFDIDIKMPRDKQEIINYNTKFFMVHRNEEVTTAPSGRRFDRTLCTGSTVASLIGAELCASISSPRVSSLRDSAMAPLVAPFSASIALHKRDTHSSYRFSAKCTKTKHHVKGGNAFSRAVRFEMDTPNSRLPRRHLLNFELDIPKRAIRFHVESPKRRIGFTGAFTNQPDHKQLQLKFFKDSSYFNVNLDGKLERRGQTIKFQPSVKVIIPGLPSISLSSIFESSPTRSSFNVELRNLLRAPVSTSGSIERHMHPRTRQITVKSRLTFHSQFFRGTYFGQAQMLPKKFLSWIVKTTYTTDSRMQPQTALFLGRVKRERTAGNDITSFSYEQRLTQFPKSRAKAKVSFKRQGARLQIRSNVQFGMKLDHNIISIIKMSVARNNMRGLSYYATSSVVYPRMGIDSSCRINLDTSPNTLVLFTIVKRRPDEETMKLNYNFVVLKSPRLKIRSNLRAVVMQTNKLRWDLTLIEEKDNYFSLRSNGILNDQTMNAVATYERIGSKHSITSNVHIGRSETMSLQFTTNVHLANPVVDLMVKRNGQAYGVSGSYNFKTDGAEQMAIDYQSEAYSPTRKVRVTGGISREEMKLKSKFVGEWDVDRDATKVMKIEALVAREEKSGKRTTQMELSIQHPIRNGHFQMSLEREAYKGSAHFELEYAPKKMFVVDSMFEIDDSWTQKGLMASVTVKTPFKRFENTHVGINLFGQLRYRKAEITILYGSNKRIITTLVVRPQGGTNFLATLKITTPFPRYSFMKFHLKNVMTDTQIQSELISELGTKKTFVQVVGVNNGDYYSNDLALAVSMTSPFENFRDLTLTLDHKDDSSQYSSNMEFKWAKDKKITATTNFMYVRNGMDITTSGELRFSSPVKELERGGISWMHQNTKSMIKSELSVQYKPDSRATITLNGLVTRPEAGAMRIIGRSTITAPGGEISAKFSHQHSKDSAKVQTSLQMPGSRLYEVDVGGKRSANRVDGSLNVNTPHAGFRKIGASFDINNDARMKIFDSQMYFGNTKAPLVTLRGKLTLPSSADPTLLLNANLISNFLRYVEISATHQHTLRKSSFNSLSALKLSGRTISVTNEVMFGKALKFKTIIGTPFDALRSLIVGFEHEGTLAKFSHTHFLSYNTNFDLQGRVSYGGINSLIAESKLSYRGMHSLRLSHQKNGAVYETIAVATLSTTKTVDFSSRITIDPKLSVEMKLATPFKAIRAATARIEAETSGLKAATALMKAQVVSTVTYTFDDKVFTMNGAMIMNSADDLRVTLNMNTPFENARDMSLVLRHNKRGKEYTTSLTGKTESGRVEISNIFQKVGTLKNKLTIKTPFSAFKSLTVDFEHRGSFPKLSHKHRLSFDVAGIKVNLANKFDIFNLRLIELETAFRSNVKNAQKAGFRFTFDKPIGGIETGILLEWPTDKLEGRIAFKANPEKKVQLKISTPFYYFKELNGLYTLGNKGVKNFNHEIILSFKNDILTIGVENSLTVQSLGYVDAQLKINTPLQDFRSFGVSYHHEMLKRTKKVEMKGVYNDKKYVVKGAYSDMPLHTVDVTVETPHQNFKAITLRGEMTFKDSMNWKLSTEYFNTELNDRVASTVDTKTEATKVDGGFKLNRNGKIIMDTRYQVSWEDKKRYMATLTLMHNRLPKNLKTGQMIFLEGSVDIRKAISVRGTLRTPFQKAENQWVSIKFERNEFLKADTMKTGNFIAEASVMNKMVMVRVSYSYGKRPSFSINIKLPDRQEMKLEGSLITSDTNSFSKMSLTAPDILPRPWTLMVDVTTAKTIGVVFKLETTIEKFETITARATITQHAKYVKINGRLSMPIINKPIEFDIENDRNTGFRVALALRGPIVRYFRSSLEFTGTAKRFDIKSEVFSNYLTSAFLTTLSFNSADGFKIDGTVKTPFTDLKSMSMEAALIKSDKRGYIEVTHYKLEKPIRAEGKIDYASSKFEGTFSLKTPFKKVESKQVTFSFVKRGYKVDAKMNVMSSALSGPFSGTLQFNYAKPKVELIVKLVSPFDAIKETGLNLVMLLQRDVNGKIEITHNKLSDRIVGRIDVQFPKTMEVELSTPFDGPYKHIKVSTVYKRDSRLTAGVTIKYYPAHTITAKVEGEVKLPKIFLRYNIATPFQVLAQTYGIVSIRAEKNFNLEASAFHNALKEKVTLTIRADDKETKTLRIRFNSPLDGPLKDVGIKLFMTPRSNAFSFAKAFTVPRTFSIGASIQYHQGQDIAFVTSFDVPSWKRWNAKIKFVTPFEVLKKLNVKGTFDIEKNVLVSFSVAHNKMSEPISTRLFIDLKSMNLVYSLSTPFNGPHKKILVEGTVTKTGDVYHYTFTTEYHKGQMIDLKGEARFEKTNMMLTFKLNTPFDAMKEVAGRLTFNLSVRPMLSFEVSHSKLSKKIKGTFHLVPMIQMKATLKTPFKGAWEKIIFDYDTKKVGKGYVATALLKYTPDKEYKVVVSHKKEAKSFDSFLTVETPFEVMKKMRAELKAGWEKMVVVTGELSHNKLSETIHTEISFRKKNPLLLQVIVTSPFEKVKSIDFKLTYTKEANKHKGGITVVYNKMKTYEFHGYLKNLKDDREVTLGMQTPHEGIWKAITVNGAFNKVAQKYKTHVKIIYNSAKTIEFNSVTNTNPKDLEVQFSLETPFKVMEKTNAKFTFKMLDSRYIRSSSNLKFVSSLTFSHSKLLNGRQVVANAKGTLIPTEKSMEVDLKLKEKEYKASMYYKKSGNKHSVGASAVTDEPTRPWFVNADITLNSANDFQVEASMSCPINRLQSGRAGVITMVLKHKGDLKAFDNSFKVASPYHGTLKYQGKLAAGPKAEFLLEGPLMKVTKVTFKHSGGFKKFETSSKVMFKDATAIVFSAEGAMAKQKVSFKGSLKTPFKAWEENSLTVSSETNMLKQVSGFSKSKLFLKSSSLGEFEVSTETKQDATSYSSVMSLRNNLKSFVSKEQTFKSTLKILGKWPEETEASLEMESSEWKENVSFQLKWKKTADTINAFGKMSVLKNYLKNDVTLEIAKMKAEESKASLSINSKSLKEPVVMKVNWKKTATSFEGSVESKAPVKFMKSKVTVQIPKMKAEESDATVEVTSTDLKEPVVMKVNWKKTATSFEGSVESKAPVKFMKSKITVQIPKMKAEESDATVEVTSTDLKEPIVTSISWTKTDKSFKAKYISSSQLDKMEVSFTIDPMSKGESSLELSGKTTMWKDPCSLKFSHKITEKDVKVTFAMRTPFENAKSVDFEFQGAQSSKKEYSGSLTMSANALGSFVSKMNIPKDGEKEVEMIVQSALKARRYRRSLSKVFSLLAKSSKTEHSIVIEVPKAKAVKKMSLKVIRSEKQVLAEASWDDKKVTVELKRPQKYTVSMIITTPFKKFEKMEGEVSASESCCTDAKFSVKINVPQGKTMFTVRWKKDSTGLSINSNVVNSLIPKVPDMNLVVVHRGEAKKFDTSVDLTFAKKEITAKVSFNIVDRKSGSITLKTPFENFKETTASVVFTGDKKKFSLLTKLKSAFGDSSIDINSANEGKPTDRQTGTAVVRFNKKAYSANYMFEGELKSFRCGFSVRPGTTRVRRSTSAPWVSFEMTSRLHLTSYDGSAKIASQFLPDGYKSMTFNAKASGDFTTFKKFDVKVTGTAASEVFMTNLKWDMGTTKSGSLEMRFPSLKNGCKVSTETSFSYGSEVKVSSNVQHCNKQLMNLKVTSDKLRKFTGSLKTPYKPINTEVKYEHSKTAKGFTGQASADNEKFGKYGAEIIVSWSSGFLGEVKVQTPNNKNVELTVRQTGTAKQADVDVSVTLPNTKVIKLRLSYNVQMPIRVEFSLETPFEVMKRTNIVVSHVQDPKRFKTSVTFEQTKLGKYVSSLSFDSSRSAFITFILQTPHPEVKDLKIDFSYTGKLTERFSQGLTGTLNGQILGYMANINVQDLLYRIVITTPFKGYERIVISNEHKGKAKQFDHAVNVEYGGKKIRMDISHSVLDSAYRGSLRFTSHFDKLRDISMTVTGTKTGPRAWKMAHELKYSPSHNIRTRGELNLDLPKLKALLQVETPFERLRRLELSSEHTHNSHTDFKFEHRLKVNDQAGALHGSLKKASEKTVGFIQLETPFPRLKHLDINMLHDGDLSKFKNDITVSWQPGVNQLRITSALDISKPQSVVASLVVNTPWAFLRTSRLEVKHSGGLMKHTQSVQFEHNGRLIRYNGMVDIANVNSLSTEHSLDTSFSKLKSMKIMLDHKNGVAHLNLSWNKTNDIKISGFLNMDKMIIGELSIETSLYNRNSATIRLRHANEIDELKSQGVLDINGMKTNVSFGYSKKNPAVTIVASLPHSASYSFRIAMRSMKNTFQGRVRVAKNRNELLIAETTVEYDLKAPVKTLSFKMNGFVMTDERKNLNIKFNFKGTKVSATTTLKATALNRHKIDIFLNYHSFKRVMASVKYNNKLYSLAWIYGKSADMTDGKNVAIKITYEKMSGGLSVDFGPNELEIDLKTPLKRVKELFIKIFHKQKNRVDFDHRSLFRLNNHRYYNFDLSVDTANGVITLRAPQSIKIRYSLAGTRFIRSLLELDFDKTDASKKIAVELFLQLNGDSSKKFNTEGFLKITSKSRVFVVESKTTVSPTTFFHKTTLRPKGGSASPWELYLSTLRHIAGHDRERTDEWILSTPVRQVKVLMETSVGKTLFKNNMDFHWDNKRVPSKKMGWKLKMMNRDTEYRSVMSFHHPALKEGVRLDTHNVVNDGNTVIRSKATFTYTDNPRDVMAFSLKISREGPTSFRGTASIRQYSTDVYTKISGSFGGNRGIYVNSLSLSHKMDGKMKVFQISTHLNVLKRSLMMEVVTPIRTYTVMGIATLTSSSAKITYQLSYDRNKKVSGDFTVSQSPSFKVRVFYNPGNADNYIEAYGKFVTQKHLEFQVHRMVSNRRFSDFLFFLKLRGEHLLKSRLFWRPTALSEAKTYVMMRIDEMKESTKVMWPLFVEAVKKEVALKRNLLIATIPNFENMRKYSKNEVELVKEDLFKLGGMVYDMYMSNEFYMRQVINGVVKMALAARNSGKMMVVSFQSRYNNIWSPYMRKMMNRPSSRFFMKLVRELVTKFAKQAKVQTNFASEFGRKHIDRVVEMIRPAIATLDSKYAEFEHRCVATAIRTVLVARYHYNTRVLPHLLRAKQIVIKSINAASTYHRNSKASILDQFHEGLRGKLGEMHGQVQRNIDLFAQTYGQIFRALRTRMNRVISRQNFDRVAFASNFIKSIIRNAKLAYDHFDMEQKLKDIGHAQYIQALDYLRENSVDVIKEYLKLEQNRFTVFQPGKGRIEGQIYVPFRMKDLRSRPDMTNFRRPMRKMYRAYKRVVPKRRYEMPVLRDIKSTVMRYVPNYETNPRAWLPAVRGYASIAGNHLITFDKVHFDLDGNCDYVLARDYKAKRFTVMLNQAEGARYLSFRAYNKVFGIHKDHSVTVDGVKVELPFVHGKLSIHRFGPIIKAKDQSLEFSLTSDVENDIHTLGVSKWYHGKLGGLFGNFDDEQYNDMQTIDHQLAGDVNVFIQSWAIRNCRHQNKETQEKVNGPIAKKICKFLFGCPLSLMSKCFSHVNPKPYATMCEKDVESSVGKLKFCRSAKLYVQECNKKSVSVKLPILCRKCKAPDNTLIKEDKSIIMENNKATADVIFVVEEAPCNKDLKPKLNEVVQRLELAFRRRGMTDIRYGMVGFGRKVHGSGCARAHSHTIDSQLMGRASSFKRALSNFEVNSTSVAAGKRVDTLRAIMTASRYPLRPGSAKHIVVVPCAACEERKTNLDDAEDALKDQDITLHVLIEHQIRMRRPDLHPQSNYMFGVDRHSVYTQKDVQKLSGDRRLFRRVLRPLDVCSQLAYTTNGAVFNSGKLTRMHVTSQAWFAEVFAKRIAMVSHSPRKVECTCVAGRWRSQLMCKKNGLSTVPMVPDVSPARPLALPARSSAQAVKLQYRR